jgi:hypothetical protein
MIRHNITGSDLLKPGRLAPAHGALRVGPARRTRWGKTHWLVLAGGVTALVLISARLGLLP